MREGGGGGVVGHPHTVLPAQIQNKEIGAIKRVYRFFGVPFHATQLI